MRGNIARDWEAVAIELQAEVERLRRRLAVAERFIPTHERHRYEYEAEHGPARRPA